VPGWRVNKIAIFDKFSTGLEWCPGMDLHCADKKFRIVLCAFFLPDFQMESVRIAPVVMFLSNST